MEPGNIIEYIDRQKIICAVVLEIKKNRLRLLTENNREVNLSESRVFYKGRTHVKTPKGRDGLTAVLKDTARIRNSLKERADVKELWDALNTEQEWIDLKTMTDLCFPNETDSDHESAVGRALFEQRVYFKSKNQSFFPNSEEHVEQSIAKEKKQAINNQIIETCGNLLKKALTSDNSEPVPDVVLEQLMEFADILKPLYLFGKESKEYRVGKAVLAKAGLRDHEGLFTVLVKMGIFSEHENIELLQHNIPQIFSEQVLEYAGKLNAPSDYSAVEPVRKDLTNLELMTIDGKLTLDYDDALSVEDHGDHWEIGIHIADVGDFVKKYDLADQAARERTSSIYTPDLKIPMLPPELAEDVCSLKADRLKPAITTMVKVSPYGDIMDHEIMPSIIKVRNQFTYLDINRIAEQDKNIIMLCNIAENFRQTRLNAGAVHVNLPEINLWLDQNSKIILKRIDRESPARMLVSELMIMANWLMARFLSEKNIPAVFRSQPGPRESIYKGKVDTIFQNIMQRKQLSRFMINSKPEHHSGLGLNAYTTATSPIRKYCDLVTQRQIRAGLGLEEPYSEKEIDEIIQIIQQPMSRVSAIQRSRNRYWLLKYLENKRGERLEAIVLYKKRNSYQILIPEYMIECDLPVSGKTGLKPEDIVRITIQHVDARRNLFSVC
jgi:exoribonuclease II